jgi:hypothetical protein
MLGGLALPCSSGLHRFSQCDAERYSVVDRDRVSHHLVNGDSIEHDHSNSFHEHHTVQLDDRHYFANAVLHDYRHQYSECVDNTDCLTNGNLNRDCHGVKLAQ